MLVTYLLELPSLLLKPSVLEKTALLHFHSFLNLRAGQWPKSISAYFWVQHNLNIMFMFQGKTTSTQKIVFQKKKFLSKKCISNKTLQYKIHKYNNKTLLLTTTSTVTRFPFLGPKFNLNYSYTSTINTDIHNTNIHIYYSFTKQT